MRAPSPVPRPRPVLVDWAARAAVVVGGVLLLNFLRPAPHEAMEADDTEALGRGQPSTPPSTRARAAGHETRDLSGRTLTLLVAGLGGGVACVIAVMIGLMGYFDHSRNAAAPPYTAQQTASITPPVPNLQATPLVDIAQLHQREDKLLYNYAWIDPARTRARVPIARAMALTVGRKLDAAP